MNATIPRPSDVGPPAQTTEPAPPHDVQPVDEEIISALRSEIDDVDGSALDPLIEDYLADSATTAHALVDAVSVDDTAQVLKLTHSWKSISAILGATQLAALLDRAEGAALRAPGELAALTTQIEQEHERVSASLRRLQHGGDEHGAGHTAEERWSVTTPAAPAAGITEGM